MDFKRAYYELLFRDRYRDLGESFQDFFSTVMEQRYPNGDFVRVRPWGNSGDRKNDGYLRSKRYLFQCFGPKSMHPLQPCLAKVKTDFKEASRYWKEYFDVWIFVHNDPSGLPAPVLELLLDLESKQKKKNVRLISWGFSELKAEFDGLTDDAKQLMLGVVPDRKDVLDVRVEAVRRLLDHIALQPEPQTVDMRPVPATKLQHNQLSDAAATLLRVGMSRAQVVQKYLRGVPDPTRYDRVAAAFRARYAELRAEDRIPDDIFVELQRFVRGDGEASTSHQAATLAILAFFFEACEIFERPPPPP